MIAETLFDVHGSLGIWKGKSLNYYHEKEQFQVTFFMLFLCTIQHPKMLQITGYKQLPSEVYLLCT